jgi:hypothetical protein
VSLGVEFDQEIALGLQPGRGRRSRYPRSHVVGQDLRGRIRDPTDYLSWANLVHIVAVDLGQCFGEVVG